MVDDGVLSTADIMARLFGKEFAVSAQRANKIVDAWNSTVNKVHDCGEQLAAHTQVVDLRNGVLIIETDHPAWTELLQLHSSFILKGLDFALKGEVKSLMFRVRRE